MSKRELYSDAVKDGGDEKFDVPFAAFVDTCRERLLDTECVPGADGESSGYLDESEVDIFQQLIKNANTAFKEIRAGNNPAPHIQDVVNLAFILNELWIAGQE